MLAMAFEAQNLDGDIEPRPQSTEEHDAGSELSSSASHSHSSGQAESGESEGEEPDEEPEGNDS